MITTDSGEVVELNRAALVPLGGQMGLRSRRFLFSVRIE